MLDSIVYNLNDGQSVHICNRKPGEQSGGNRQAKGVWTGKMATILLLEDEENLNRGIEFSLTKEGYEVLSAKTIEEAEMLFQNNEIDLCICDLTLPDGNGLDFISRLRRHSSVYVFCLTALDQEMDQVLGYEAGADDYITKPFSLSVLTLKINAYFKRNYTQAETVIESGTWQFYMREMKAVNGRKDVLFSKNEWKLLCLFLEHPRQILSKGQILERIFDVDGNFVDDNTVAVNIRRLREKIEPDAARPKYIQNVRGLGYVWNQECRKR